MSHAFDNKCIQLRHLFDHTVSKSEKTPCLDKYPCTSCFAMSRRAKQNKSRVSSPFVKAYLHIQHLVACAQVPAGSAISELQLVKESAKQPHARLQCLEPASGGAQAGTGGRVGMLMAHIEREEARRIISEMDNGRDQPQQEQLPSDRCS